MNTSLNHIHTSCYTFTRCMMPLISKGNCGVCLRTKANALEIRKNLTIPGLQMANNFCIFILKEDNKIDRSKVVLPVSLGRKDLHVEILHAIKGTSNVVKTEY